ncbi:MAG: hypothetical protein GY953_17360, partial [bacterium]|nr:hypothetical protein [bacterium]
MRPARIHPGYTEIAQASPWTIFELPTSSLVDVAEFMPSVYEPTDEVGVVERIGLILRENEELDDFFSGAVDWHAQVETLDHWLVESGPPDWPRTQEGFGGLSATAPIPDGGVVSAVELEDDRISFDTTAIGAPHLVKVSFFPNWKVTG